LSRLSPVPVAAVRAAAPVAPPTRARGLGCPSRVRLRPAAALKPHAGAPVADQSAYRWTLPRAITRIPEFAAPTLGNKHNVVSVDVDV
jgi:hypothetical protein